MNSIETIFFYRSFLCWCDRQGCWKIQCLDYHYIYSGKGGKEAAKAQVEYFLNVRHGKQS
ncbi:hypothetical protein [Microcoleus sp. T2B6]|uniref:hypothetical protein n=1 Tax=Microcoleus sp. T2B6 TaxID=3055424 RepID=UPI002FD52AB1